MTARIGADDVDPFESSRPSLLREITGIEPEPTGSHVLLEHIGIRSTQRLALGDVGGGIVVALWPAELKPQAEYLYQAGRGQAMVAAARRRGWEVKPSPHLAFRNSRPSQRLYMAPDIDAKEYADRWQEADAQQIGQHSREHARDALWPWLKTRSYVDSGDDPVLERFLVILGRRDLHLRPAMRFTRRWQREEVSALGDQHELASAIRRDVDEILRAAQEPTLSAATRL